MRALDGITDVEVDAVRMELIVTRDRSKVELRHVIDAVRQAGFQADSK